MRTYQDQVYAYSEQKRVCSSEIFEIQEEIDFIYRVEIYDMKRYDQFR